VDATQRIVESLAELGFSQYEARAYVGLVGQEALTGYALANRTQIPQPKVYETLRRLEEKRAVVRTGSDPARFVAVPPDRLVATISDQYRERLDSVRSGLSDLDTAGAGDGLRVLESVHTWAAVRSRVAALLEGAERHVYLSSHADLLAELAEPLAAADARGVRCDVLSFGPSTGRRLENGRMLEHSSTAGVVYRHHQARHVAVVADSQQALWALAPDGVEWDGMQGQDPLLVAVVKGYIRHDVYVQQIFHDFRDELVGAYGPALEGLVLPRAEEAGAEAAEVDQPATRPSGPRRTKRTA
jgi:sugar-specific transcriptional regulator TrmB